MAGRGKPWKKGQSGNPTGRSNKVRVNAKIRRMTVEQVSEVGTLILTQDRDALMNIGKNPDATVLQVWMAGLIATSMKKGDANIFRALLDRVIGRPREFKELTGADGGPLLMRAETEQEKVARVEKLRRDREETGADPDNED